MIHAATEILRGAYNGVAPAVLRQRIERAMERIDATRVDFQPMTLAELMARDVTVEYLIDNLLAARQPILLAGPVKSLKTSILLDLCLALATGGCFLGYFRVLRSIAVAILTGESGLPTLKDTLDRIAHRAGIDPTAVTRLIISDRIPHLSSLEHLDALRRLILDYELELLAIDPAYLALDGTDAANVMIFGQQLRAVSEMCQEMGVALLLCHHTKKGSGIDGEPLALTDAAWSGFAEHTRQWLLVNHRERYDQESATHRLWLSVGGSAGHGGFWAVDVHQGHISDVGGQGGTWRLCSPRTCTETRPTNAKQQRKPSRQTRLEADKRKVVNAMVKSPDGETAKVIRGRAGISGDRFNVVISSLLDDGAAVEVQLAKPNRKAPYDGYKLAE